MRSVGSGFISFVVILKTEDLFELTVSLSAKVHSYIFVNASLILISSEDGFLLCNSRDVSSANNLTSNLK